MRTLREALDLDDTFLVGVELLSTRAILGTELGVRAHTLAADLAVCRHVDWVSITDNAGGNPALSPVALGKPLLYAGKEVVIHLSCKDFNRNGLESVALQLASEGFHNILALSGDYPVKTDGGAKPVFDLDSIGLLALLDSINRKHGIRFLTGAVTTNFKLHENEVVPQYLKLEKKLDVGAEFIISQIGFDSRKSDELLAYLEAKGRKVPVAGNVFLLSGPVARYFRTGKIPGVLLPDALFEECERQAASPDEGKVFFRELAARQVAVLRGLGYRAAYIGGVRSVGELEAILAVEKGFAADDWRTFAREIRHSRRGEFFYFTEDPRTGLVDRTSLGSVSASPARARRLSLIEALQYRFSKWVHAWLFAPRSRWFRMAKKLYSSSANPEQGPVPLRVVERASKRLLFGCEDCGDCSLPDTAFLCPESACAKNQRNGPCGGTRDGKCEVDDIECIWARAYDRLKSDGREEELLEHSPVIQDQALWGTSAWANSFLGRDHHGRAHLQPVLTVKVEESKTMRKQGTDAGENGGRHSR